MKEILQYAVVPIITALITAVITYLSTKANNKTQVELAIKNQEIKLQELNNQKILLKEKEIEQLKLNHELELKSKEADVTNPIMGEYLKEIIKDPSK
jgi:predicted metalloprotease